jgi:hypothetical protein
VARLEPDGSVVFAAPSAEVAVLQREAEPAGGDGATTAVAAVAAGAPAAGATTDAAGGGAAAGNPTGAALGNEQLELLAKQLYDRIRERLRTELRLDRERWGRVTDLVR